MRLEHCIRGSLGMVAHRVQRMGCRRESEAPSTGQSAEDLRPESRGGASRPPPNGEHIVKARSTSGPAYST